MSTIVIMPGGFHPFHAGHYSLYNDAKKTFPGAEVYVAATNDMSERPFPFSLKEKLAKLAGVDAGHFVQVKSPFQAKEITQNYNPEQDVLIFVRSEKDRNESPKPGGIKKDGTPAYFQPWTGKDVQPFAKHAYFAYLPTVEFGPGITSATQIRKAWPTLDDRRKTAMVMSLYPATQKNPKLAQNVVGMFDQVMGGQLNEFAPGNGDDGLPYAEYVVYQCDPKDQFEFIGKPLYQTDSLGMAHKFAYEYFLRYRPKAFVVYQPHKEASRGNYGVKGKSDEDVTETKSKTIAQTAKDLKNPPSIMQHRAKRDQEREETYRNAQFGKDDLENEGDVELQQLMRKAQQRYPTMPGKQQAFIKFVQRSLKHSEEEDNQQDQEIKQIKAELNKIEQDHKKIMKVTESADYIEEK